MEVTSEVVTSIPVKDGSLEAQTSMHSNQESVWLCASMEQMAGWKTVDGNNLYYVVAWFFIRIHSYFNNPMERYIAVFDVILPLETPFGYTYVWGKCISAFFAA